MEYVFLIVIACGVFSFICVILIPADIIDHNVARNAKVTQKEQSGQATTETSFITSSTSSQATTETKKVKPHESASNQSYTEVATDFEVAVESESVEAQSEVEYMEEKVEVKNCLDVLLDRNILMFSMNVFLFHLSNAAVLPLLGQLGGIKGATRSALPFTSACLVVGEFSAIPSSWMVMRVKDCISKKLLMSLGFASLFPRCASIALISMFGHSNVFLLASTQLLDGIGVGITGISAITYIRVLTMGSGRFSAVFGSVDLATSIGASFSNLLGGYLAHQSYELAFIVLGAMSVLPIITLNLGVDSPKKMAERGAKIEKAPKAKIEKAEIYKPKFKKTQNGTPQNQEPLDDYQNQKVEGKLLPLIMEKKL